MALNWKMEDWRERTKRNVWVETHTNSFFLFKHVLMNKRVNQWLTDVDVIHSVQLPSGGWYKELHNPGLFVVKSHESRFKGGTDTGSQSNQTTGYTRLSTNFTFLPAAHRSRCRGTRSRLQSRVPGS